MLESLGIVQIPQKQTCSNIIKFKCVKNNNRKAVVVLIFNVTLTQILPRFKFSSICCLIRLIASIFCSLLLFCKYFENLVHGCWRILKYAYFIFLIHCWIDAFFLLLPILYLCKFISEECYLHNVFLIDYVSSKI